MNKPQIKKENDQPEVKQNEQDQLPNEISAEKPAPTKVTLTENYKFEVPLVGRPDVFINVSFKAKQEVTDTHTIKHLMEANAPISFAS